MQGSVVTERQLRLGSATGASSQRGDDDYPKSVSCRREADPSSVIDEWLAKLSSKSLKVGTRDNMAEDALAGLWGDHKAQPKRHLAKDLPPRRYSAMDAPSRGGSFFRGSSRTALRGAGFGVERPGRCQSDP